MLRNHADILSNSGTHKGLHLHHMMDMKLDCKLFEAGLMQSPQQVEHLLQSASTRLCSGLQEA